MLRGGLMGLCHCNKCWRSWATVQIFIGASDGKIDFMKVESDLHHADRMTEVPHHQRAGVVQLSGNGGHVEKFTGAIVDVGEHSDRDLSIEQGLDGWTIR